MTILREHRGRGTLLLLLLLLAVVAGIIGIHNYVTGQAKHQQEYRKLVEEMRASAQRMDDHAYRAVHGDVSAFYDLKRSRDRFERAILRLQGGDASLGLPPFAGGGAEAVEQLAVAWRRYRNNADTILAYQDEIYRRRERVEAVKQRLPALRALAEEIAGNLVNRGARARHVYTAGRQLLLLERIGHSLDRIQRGGADSDVALRQFRRDLGLFQQAARGLLQGDRALGITRVRNAAIRRQLDRLVSATEELESALKGIDAVIPVIDQANGAATAMDGGVEVLLQAIDRLGLDDDAAFERQLRRWTGYSYLLGALAVVLLVLIAYQLRREDRKRLLESEKQKRLSEAQNRRNQQAILQLLDEMGAIAEGDLTVETTVREDITGAIADSVNYTLEALRLLVRSINETTEQVRNAAQEVQDTTHRLTLDSNQQAERIQESARAVNGMAEGVKKISADAALLGEEADRVVVSAARGMEAAHDAAQGMEASREKIQSASDCIRRLGDSSHEIGRIVAVIAELAEQTNILALNASLQVATAGDTGQPFSVVAGEVQQLAERSTSATRKIETLIATIQADAREAIRSMEQGTEEVTNGSRLAREAAEHLESIEQSAGQVAGLIQGISREAASHVESAAGISEGMEEIQRLTLQTSESLERATEAIRWLVKSVDTLRESVAGFKLPD